MFTFKKYQKLSELQKEAKYGFRLGSWICGGGL